MERKIVLKDNIIEALLESVGAEGTIMMPTQSRKNLDPTAGAHWEEPEEWWELIRDNWPVYDKDITPTNTMGAVAEMFRKWSGTFRSDHPARSVAANGKYAEYLTKKHDISNIFGEDFEEIGAAFENVCSVHKATLDNGVIRLMKQRDLVDFAVRWIEENRK